MAARDFGENVAQERVEGDSIRLYGVSLQSAGFHLTETSYHNVCQLFRHRALGWDNNSFVGCGLRPSGDTWI